DPMEKALKDLGRGALSNTEHLHDDWSLVQEYPLSKNLLTMSRVWRSPDKKNYVIAAKGAPEAIADICHLNKEKMDRLSLQINDMAAEGLRIIGIAKSEFRQTTLPEGQHDFKFRFLGLVGLADPVRPGVAEAIRECHNAGIRVVMITGDYPITAQKIAAQIGLKPADEVITGAELDAMENSELQRRIGKVNIFARVVPEQKLKIVDALKANGEIVAMTGDGVNDAPALKSAHIGIAMGGRGTDVAREASALVLLDDDFSSIVQAVRMGRRIFDNLKKAMAYIFAIHIPIVGMSLIPVFFRWPLVLLPVHIVFLELIIDPACSVVFEAEQEEKRIMDRPPRSLKESLFDKKTIAYSVLQGLVVLAVVLSVFVIAIERGHGELDARALSFTTLIIANLGLILTNRSWSHVILTTLSTPNPALWWVVGGALVLLGTVLYVPFLQDLFRFDRLHPFDLAICLFAGIVSILWFEGLKMIRRQ
ncbi:MAG TPA: cation-translocating P-type ATPase, partial [Thermodesulfovibrionales bacterium]|nr:cation-translocating P-type ATPase [Thermodesulfovibrionales bacterium]